MAPPDIHVLSSMDEDEEVDEYMLDWYEKHDSNLRRTEEGLLNAAPIQNFRTAIAQCASAYRRREYAISIPCLPAVLEAGIRALAPRENFWSTRIKEVVCKMYNSAKTDEAASFWVFMWLSLFGFVTRSHASYEKTQVGSVRIFRHGVQHGTQPPADNAIEALRLFHVLASIASLHEKTSTKLRAGSDRSKPFAVSSSQDRYDFSMARSRTNRSLVDKFFKFQPAQYFSSRSVNPASRRK